MKDSPFVYGKIVSKKSFTDREVDSKRLYSNLVNGINTMLISPRRWGKSSLVEKVVCDINTLNKEYKTVVIDMFSVGNKEEFLEIFAKEIIRATSSKIDDIVSNVKSFFKHLSPKLSFDVSSSECSLSFDRNELAEFSEEVLNLPEVIAQTKGVKIIVCIDEFQDLTSFSDYDSFEKKMRAVWQRQKNVTYCLYGSKRHMMSDIFNNPSKPFYRFGDIIMLQKISKEKWVSFLCESFEKTSKEISLNYANLIADLMRNHSWYVQQFAHYVWNKTEKIVDREILMLALTELINSNLPFFMREVEGLSPTQLNFLKAAALNEYALSSVVIINKYMLGTSANVSKNKVILIQKDILNFENDVYEFLDPVFELWFKKFFLKIDYLDLIK